MALGGESVTNSLSLAGEVGKGETTKTLKLMVMGMFVLCEREKMSQLFLSIPFGEGKDRIDLVQKFAGGCVF